VSDASGLSDTSTATITVTGTGGSGSTSGGGGGGALGIWALLGCLGLALFGRLR
jgi:hypothetical protein